MDSLDKNKALLRILETLPLITTIWLSQPSNNYSNWAGLQSTRQLGKDCIQLRNEVGENRGKWVEVSCSETSSVICEKTVALSYSKVVQYQIELQEKIKLLENNIKAIQKKNVHYEEEIANLKTLVTSLTSNMERSKRNHDGEIEQLNGLVAQTKASMSTLITSNQEGLKLYVNQQIKTAIFPIQQKMETEKIASDKIIQNNNAKLEQQVLKINEMNQILSQLQTRMQSMEAMGYGSKLAELKTANRNMENRITRSERENLRLASLFQGCVRDINALRNFHTTPKPTPWAGSISESHENWSE